MASSATRDQILDVAQELLQTRGYNAFSYRDIAQVVGIKSASIHYHYPAKDALGEALVRRYREDFGQARARLDAETEPRRRLERYAKLFAATLARGHRMCLCGMLAADFTTLPAPVQDQVRAFFDENEAWLAGVLAQGRLGSSLQFTGTPRSQGQALLATLEGAMLAARAAADPRRFQAIASQALNSLTP